MYAHLVFVYYPAPSLLVFTFMESLVLDYLVHRYMLETRRSCQLLCMCCFPHARCTGYNNVWILARHGES